MAGEGSPLPRKKCMSDWYVYIIDRKEKLYVGITTDLPNRMRQHAVMEPLHVEGPMSKAEALKLDRELKGWSRSRKPQLISKGTGKLR